MENLNGEVYAIIEYSYSEDGKNIGKVEDILADGYVFEANEEVEIKVENEELDYSSYIVNKEVKVKLVEYEVEYLLGNITTNGEKTATIEGYEATLTAKEGYTLTEKVMVTVDGIVLTQDKDYTYSNGVLKIAEGKITGKVVIKADAKENSAGAPGIPEGDKPTDGGVSGEGQEDENLGTGSDDKNTSEDADKDTTKEPDKDTDKDTNKGNTNNGSNPQTGDNIILFVAIFVIAIIGIVATTKIKKHNKK